MKKIFLKMPVNVPKGKHNSGKTLNRFISEDSNGSKKQKKAEKKVETSLQCAFVAEWGKASAITGCSMCFKMGRRILPKNTSSEIPIYCIIWQLN